MAFKGLRFAGLEWKNITASKIMWVVIAAIAIMPLLYGALYLACEMAAAGRSGSIVSLVCDGTERYDATVNDDTWLAAQGIDPEPYVDVVERAWTTGVWAG